MLAAARHPGPQMLSELVPDLAPPPGFQGDWPSEGQLLRQLSAHTSAAAGEPADLASYPGDRGACHRQFPTSDMRASHPTFPLMQPAVASPASA